MFAGEDDGFICGFTCWEALGDTCKVSGSVGIAAAWRSGNLGSHFEVIEIGTCPGERVEWKQTGRPGWQAAGKEMGQ